VAKHADYCNPELSENTDERAQAAGNGARVRLMLLMGDLDLGLLCGDGESERAREREAAQHNVELFDPAKPSPAHCGKAGYHGSALSTSLP
jgi:hypothetical protein